MLGFTVRRILRVLLTLFCIITIVFLLTRITGDPSQWLLPDDATEEVREQLRESLGLNRPVLIQYLEYLARLVQGDMGDSFRYRRPVIDIFAERAQQTIYLGLIALALSVVVGIPAGVIAAVKRNSVVDRVSMTLAVAGDTIPNFVLGILLIFLFSLVLGLLPSGGSGTQLHYILPVVTLAAASLSSIARLTRSSMLDVLRQDFLDTARAKGVPEHRVVVKHALRNALIVVLTIIGLQMGTLIGGAVVVETVFAWPGIGSLIVSSAQSRDFPSLQFGVLVVSVTVLVSNLLVDLSYGLLDPRIRVDVRRG